MTCFAPLQGFRSAVVGKTGKRKIVFRKEDALGFSIGLDPQVVQVPCGQCIGCRLDRSRHWAVRCVHEAQMYDSNCFITLTYDDDHLPSDRSLDVSVFQKFMKRLRKKFSGVRFFHCGEYGEQFGRPHYHAILFNIDFSDKYLFKINNGCRLYRSSMLESLWPFGHSSIGDVTFESAAYVARYCLKKVTGSSADLHYARNLNVETGELSLVKPEYTTMSRRPGIGKKWFDQFSSDVYPGDFVVVRSGKEHVCSPPRYYDNLYEVQYPSDLALIKSNRKKNAMKHSENNTFERLKVREKVKKAQISKLVRVVD